jgi:hypothetical protein
VRCGLCRECFGLHIGIARQRLAPCGGTGNMHVCPGTHRAAVSIGLLKRTAKRNHLSCHDHAPCPLITIASMGRGTRVAAPAHLAAVTAVFGPAASAVRAITVLFVCRRPLLEAESAGQLAEARIPMGSQ